MSNRQTDNKNLPAKLHIRNKYLPEKDHIHVLDAFCGDGTIWNSIQNQSDKEFSVTGIDEKVIPKRIYLKGDNVKFLKVLDLSIYDIIDLDAYGFPFDQLEVLFERGYTGTVFITSAGSIGKLPDKMNILLGYSKAMLKKIPSLFYKHKFRKICQYLAMRGIATIDYIAVDGNQYIHMEMA